MVQLQPEVENTGINQLPRSPLFTIIVVDYDKSVTRDQFARKMKCLAAQTCKDFEVLVYHDGPKTSSYDDDINGMEIHPDTKFHITARRENDWGHSNRDRGIRAARGEWIIHTNADNVFYPDLIESLKARIDSPMDIAPMIKKPRFPFIIKSIVRRFDKYLGTSFIKIEIQTASKMQILIYAILMRGVVPCGNLSYRLPNGGCKHSVVFGGIPVKYANIDAMQLVMRRDLWLAEGGWYDKRETSDGYMYPKFAKKYKIDVVAKVLGEHW